MAALGIALVAATGAAASEGLALPVDPDVLNAETVSWLRDKVPDEAGQFSKLSRILEALQRDPDGPRVRYQEGYTGTAQEAFDTGQVNCLSFSQLVVAMARELGVEAFYMDIRKFQRYTKEGDLIIVAGHTTAGFDKGPERVILEFSVGPQVNYREAVRISDATARAYYHSNRGAETLQAGDLDGAAEWLQAAVELDPGLPDAWVNLGVALRRQGEPRKAEEVYRRAIALDSEFFPAYQNLAALFRLRGDTDGATRLLEILERQRTRNPFVYLALGDLSLEQGNLEDAGRFFKRGRRLRRRDPDLLAALGEVALAAGGLAEARRWLSRGRRASPENARVQRLANAIERASEGSL